MLHSSLCTAFTVEKDRFFNFVENMGELLPAVFPQISLAVKTNSLNAVRHSCLEQKKKYGCARHLLICSCPHLKLVFFHL